MQKKDLFTKNNKSHCILFLFLIIFGTASKILSWMPAGGILVIAGILLTWVVVIIGRYLNFAPGFSKTVSAFMLRRTHYKLGWSVYILFIGITASIARTEELEAQMKAKQQIEQRDSIAEERSRAAEEDAIKRESEKAAIQKQLVDSTPQKAQKIQSEMDHGENLLMEDIIGECNVNLKNACSETTPYCHQQNSESDLGPCLRGDDALLQSAKLQI